VRLAAEGKETMCTFRARMVSGRKLKGCIIIYIEDDRSEFVNVLISSCCLTYDAEGEGLIDLVYEFLTGSKNPRPTQEEMRKPHVRALLGEVLAMGELEAQTNYNLN